MVLVSGNNGIGKSTFLRYLAGLETPSSGEVLWNGSPVAPRPMSYLSQQYSQVLLHWHSAIKNLDLVLEGADANDRNDRRQEFVKACDQFLGENTANSVPISLLSGGQQHIAAIVIALAAPGPLVILDEPFSGLTYANAKLMAAFIDQKACGRTIVLASHTSRTSFVNDLGVNIDNELQLTEMQESEA